MMTIKMKVTMMMFMIILSELDTFLKLCYATRTDLVVFFFFSFFQANVVLKEKETFIEYLQKQLNETKSKLDSEVSIASMPTLSDYTEVF